ncbi:MAG: hydroxymethylbilane synthase, partial [Flammeovirgaceae bacterium]
AHTLRQHGMEASLETMETIGDKILDRTLSKIGSKGVFTEELEAKLLNGQIDIAVHSAKDLPSSLPEGLEIIAFTEREDPADVVVSYNRYLRLDDDSQKLVLGTSSTRRVALIKHYFPKIRLVDMRGNLQTRMKKMQDGSCDGLILAYAGVHRMEYDSQIIQKLPLDQFTPAVGQGSLAIEAATSLDQETRDLVRKALNHAETEYRLLAERAYLRALDGGCSIPSYAIAFLEGEQLRIHGGIISLNGRTLIREEMTAPKEEATALGADFGKLILGKGGDKILEEIRNPAEPE